MSNARLEQAVARAALERAHAARLDNDLLAVLDHLLAAWAAVRDLHLADAISILSHEARALRPAVTDESQWLFRCSQADSIELGRLLEKLPRRLSLLLPGLEQLADRTPDPRLASVGMRLRDVEPWVLGASFMTPHLDPVYLSALRHQRDLETRSARREEIARSVRDHEQFRAMRATSLDAGGRLWLEAIIANESAPRCEDTRELALLAEIVARPKDMDPRAVYADLLLQRGDAFGELVTLQLRLEQGADISGARKRVAVLIRERGREWFGNLAAVVDFESLVWRAGFGLRGAIVGFDGAPRLEPRQERWLETHPGLRTFVELVGASDELEAWLVD